MYHSAEDFRHHAESLNKAFLETANQYAVKNFHKPLDLAALSQMSISTMELTKELLMLGVDVWPTRARAYIKRIATATLVFGGLIGYTTACHACAYRTHPSKPVSFASVAPLSKEVAVRITPT